MIVTVSPSTIAWLMECPLKFHEAQNRPYDSGQETQPHLRFGTALHDALARIYSHPQDLRNMDAIADHLRAAFRQRPYSDEECRRHDIQRGGRLICAYLGEMDDAPYNILGVERRAAFPVKICGEVAYRISARHDLILVRESEPDVLILRDWKVCRQPATATLEQKWIMLTALRWAFPKYSTLRLEIDTFHDEIACERAVYNTRDLKGVVNCVNERVLDYLSTDKHLPTPGPGCQWCERRALCESEFAIDSAVLDFD